ncbi:MAG: hypothetical protein ABIP60_00915 [Novosphingobium sp.]
MILPLALGLNGCAKIKQNDPHDAVQARAEARRQQAACASPAANDRLKTILFDRAISAHDGDPANLETLADYSLVRMEEPIVKGWDPALDITRCKSRLILQLPPGAERAFEGERQLRADIDYTAQAAADGRGFVYQVNGAEPIVNRLAGFNLTSQAYRPPPAIDEAEGRQDLPESTKFAEADAPPQPPPRPLAPRPTAAPAQRPVAPATQRDLPPPRDWDTQSPEPRTRSPASVGGANGEAIVRSFYNALGAGNGAAASSHVVPEKRSGRAFSPEAINRFYGRLPEPIRLTGIRELAPGSYRVSYRYSAGRSHCNGSAVVRLTQRNGRDLIRSIQALSGC